METNYTFLIAAVMVYLFSILCILIEKGINKIQNKMILILVCGNMLAAGFSIACSICDGLSAQYEIYHTVMEYGYHITHSCMAYIMALYMIGTCGLWHKKSSKSRIIAATPLIIFYVILATNPFTKLAFTVEGSVYTRGPAIYLEYAIALIYLLNVIIMAFKYKDSIGLKKSLVICAFIVLSLSGVFVQLVNPKLLVEIFMESLGVLGIIVTVEDEGGLIDYATDTYNRNAYIEDNLRMIKAKSNYMVVYVKLTNYRKLLSTLGAISINDVLYDVALYLKDVAYAYNVYYVEDGTFAITDFDWNEDKTRELVADLENKFSLNWTYNAMTIPFATQIYLVKLPKDVSSVNHLLTVVDSEHDMDNKSVQVYEGEELRFVQHEEDIRHAIKKAIKHGTLKVYYQPIWDTKTQTIRSCEALVRLIDDDMGFISPEEFIPIAEKSGQVIDIGNFVFETVCKNIKEDRFKDLGIDFVDVNLSPIQCMQSDIVDVFDMLLKKYDVDPSVINLEITETATAENQSLLLDTIVKLKERGFKFSLDDYGTGFANLSYMVDMDFNIIKIDKSILWNAEKNNTSKVMLDNTIRMIKEMGMNIVTEGVETVAQRDYLKNAGCDFCQGYYFSKPVDEESFVKFLQEFEN